MYSPVKPYPFSLLQEWFRTALQIDNDPLIVNFYIKKAEALGLITSTKTPSDAEGVHFCIPDKVMFITWTRSMASSRGIRG